METVPINTSKKIITTFLDTRLYNPSSFILHIFIALRSIVFYFIKTIFPVNLSAVYPLWNIQTVEPLYIVSLFIFIGISVFVFRSAKKNNNRILVFSWFGYILNILPVSGIVPIPYMVNSFVADRYSYIPGLFLAVFLITAAERIIKLLKISSKEIAIAVLIFLAGLSWQQAKAWKDTRTLWEYVLVLYPDCKNAHANLGTYYSNRNFLDKAFFHYQKAHNLSSEGALCNYNMGVIYGQLEDFKKAEAYYRTALEIKPQYPDALCNLGNALYRQGRMEEAVYYLNEALKYEHSPVIEKAVKVNFKLIEDYMKNINK